MFRIRSNRRTRFRTEIPSTHITASDITGDSFRVEMEVMEVGSGIDRNEKATRAKATVLNFVCISGTILHDNI